MTTRAARIPKPPKELTVDAQARWTSVLPALLSRGAVDLETLRTYCQVWARWRQAEDALARGGQITKTPTGRFVPSPLLQVSKDAANQARALEARLGITLAVTDAPAGTESHGDLLTRRDLAAQLGVHMMTVTKWERDGLPVAARGRKGKPSTYREADVRAWIAARETAAKRDGLVDVAQERARKERAQATLAEQTYQARQRELLPAGEVAQIWGAEVQAVRTAILATYTTQADRVHRVATLEGVAGVERELKAIAHELLRELSSPERPLPVMPRSEVA